MNRTAFACQVPESGRKPAGSALLQHAAGLRRGTGSEGESNGVLQLYLRVLPMTLCPLS